MSERARPGGDTAALACSLIALAVVFLSPVALPAQGLGDAAGRERQRREKKPAAAAKVFTNEDLSDGEDADTGATGSDGAGDAVEGDAEGPPELVKVGAADPLREQLDREREERALQEREWRARFKEARARVREEEARCWREVVRTEFYQGVPVQMKVQEFVESEAFRQAKRDLADLEEEFRQSGHPPGWARE
ncbi:MAG: hypothetical protein LJF15_15460 [Acidobacteria bacterium]|nr:hypothetical protein [Acidobacteriota bacterium]